MTSQTQTSAQTTKDGLNNGGLPTSNTSRGTAFTNSTGFVVAKFIVATLLCSSFVS